MSDVSTFIFALVAVDFTTWIVLPWAFYDQLNERGETGALGRLKRAQGYFFASGLFFLLYAILFLAVGSSAFTDIAKGYLNFMGDLAILFGTLTFALALSLSFFVVNAYVNLGEDEIDLFRLIAIPFVAFIDIVLAVNVYPALLELSILTPEQLAGNIVMILSILGTGLGYAWMHHIAEVKEQGITRGFIAALLLILPWLVALFIGAYPQHP